MSDLKKLTDQVLIEATDRVVAREREALISIHVPLGIRDQAVEVL